MDQYIRIAQDYHRQTEQEFLADNKRKLFEELSLRPEIKSASGWSVLDVGCGTGIHASYFAEQHPDAKSVVGVDASKEMIAIARENSRNAILEFHVASMDALPFEDDSFDFIFSRNAVHYSVDLNITFKELGRVLRPGGKLYVQVNHPIFGLFLKKSRDYSVKETEVSFTVESGGLAIVHPVYSFGEYLNALSANGLILLKVGEYMGKTSNVNDFKIPTTVSFLLTKSNLFH